MDNRSMHPTGEGKFTIGLIQMSCGPDPAENLEKAVWRTHEAAGKGAQIVCLQKLFRTQYFCREERPDLFDLAEPIPGPTYERFTKLALELKVVIIAAIFERRTAGVYHNTVVVIDADGSSFCSGLTTRTRKVAMVPATRSVWATHQVTTWRYASLGREPIPVSAGQLAGLLGKDRSKGDAP